MRARPGFWLIRWCGRKPFHFNQGPRCGVRAFSRSTLIHTSGAQTDGDYWDAGGDRACGPVLARSLQDWVPESVSRVSEPALLAVVKKISMLMFSCLMTSEAPRYKVPPSSPARVSVFTFLLSCVGGSQKFSTSILIRWASVGVSMVVLPPRRSWPL